MSNSATCTEVWVEAGTYAPTGDDDHTISFSILPGVEVYSGFAGSEAQRSERDPAANLTILSGEIGGDGISDNSYHVVLMDGTTDAGGITDSTVLDGFTVSGGNAGNSADPEYVGLGGGLYCNGSDVSSGSGSTCSPTLGNLTFSGNSADHGGAIYNEGSGEGISSPTLSNVIFSGNSADIGGAMYNDAMGSGISSPTLSNVTFSDNNAAGDTGEGGAIFNAGYDGGISSPALSDVTFTGNSASSGGAMYSIGFEDGVSSPTLSNVTFSYNSASYGGAMLNDGYRGTSNPTLSNVTFSNNSASSGGGAILNSAYQGGSSPTLTNVTFSGNSANVGSAMLNDGFRGTSNPTLSNVIAWGDSAGQGPEICNVNPAGGNAGNSVEVCSESAIYTAIDHSVIQGSGGISGGWDPALGIDGGGNLDADPLLGAPANNGGYTQTLLPGAGSSAIDAGNDSTCAAPPVNGLDQRGVARPQGPHCDIGAVEVDTDSIFVDNFDGPPTP